MVTTRTRLIHLHREVPYHHLHPHRLLEFLRHPLRGKVSERIWIHTYSDEVDRISDIYDLLTWHEKE
jgi:hypothetical protein